MMNKFYIIVAGNYKQASAYAKYNHIDIASFKYLFETNDLFKLHTEDMNAEIILIFTGTWYEKGKWIGIKKIEEYCEKYNIKIEGLK